MFRLCETGSQKSLRPVRTKAIASRFVMCELGDMVEAPGTQELADKAGISKSYASEILAGKRPTLGRPLAIHIYRTTGWRHQSIADLTDDQVDMLEEIERWSPREAA
jgi:transcriptional regulator with XRE-family HTH domain